MNWCVKNLWTQSFTSILEQPTDLNVHPTSGGNRFVDVRLEALDDGRCHTTTAQHRQLWVFEALFYKVLCVWNSEASDGVELCIKKEPNGKLSARSVKLYYSSMTYPGIRSAWGSCQPIRFGFERKLLERTAPGLDARHWSIPPSDHTSPAPPTQLRENSTTFYTHSRFYNILN